MIEQADDVICDLPVELAGITMEVSHLYAFLANLYRAELSQQQLRRLQNPEMQPILAAAGMDMSGDFWHRSEASQIEELAVEFTALFLGPGGHISPHESVQIEQQGAYWGEATTAVRDFIAETGMGFRNDFQGIPDHISVELEFLAELTRRESKYWQQGDQDRARNCLEIQRDFLDEHLGRWVDKFCTRIMETAELPFYREVAKMTVLFVSSETKDVDERLRATRSLASPALALQTVTAIDQAQA